MAEEEDRKGRPPRGPVHVLELRRRAGGAEVAIVRILREPDSVGRSEDVWTNRFASFEAASIVMQAMMGRPDRWAAWARMASILGADFLTGLIEAEVVEAAETAAQHKHEVPRDVELRGRAERRSDSIEVSLVLEGGPRIVASRGNLRFMVLMLDATVDAWRVWDWVRWQTESLHDWYLMVRRHGATALEQFILESMFAEEAKEVAAGRSAGGRRPLRHWRPAAKRDDREGGSGARYDG